MPESVVLIVGRRIRELRQKKGWSQEKLAEEAGLHRTYIGQVERGEKSIGIENLVRIARALGARAATLLTSVE
jgi:transcriptional regulator with XRE-family HTH domain